MLIACFCDLNLSRKLILTVLLLSCWKVVWVVLIILFRTNLESLKADSDVEYFISRLVFVFLIPSMTYGKQDELYGNSCKLGVCVSCLKLLTALCCPL